MRFDIHHKSCLYTDDGSDALVFGDLIEFDGAVHTIVIRDAYGVHSERFRLCDNLIGLADGFQEREGAMSVKMGKHIYIR